MTDYGKVITWGKTGFQGDYLSVLEQAPVVVDTIYENNGFAAVLHVGVDIIYSNPYAFAAVLPDGTVLKWGFWKYGGDSIFVSEDLVGIDVIYSTDKASAALRQDGSVVTWGSHDHGGDLSSVSEKLVGVGMIYFNH